MPRIFSVWVFSFCLAALLIAMFATRPTQAQALGCTTQALELAQLQLSKTIGYISSSAFPQLTVPPTNHWNSDPATDWSSGFFPGWLWYMYEQTLDSSLLSRAQAQTANLAGETTDATDLNVGFRIMASYGNGYAVTQDPRYMNALQTGANTMASLYSSSAGVIDSYPSYNPGKISVIIDNMPALEILFFAAAHGGDPAWYNMAVSHALKTPQNNVRADGSTYQGVEYNSDGSVYTHFTNDGASANSTWSRGQAWGIYGFTMTYRYTQDPRFLATAQQLADYFIGNLPPDYVPVWDFTKPWTDPRDSSAAAIAAAALLELSTDMSDSTTKAYYYEAAMNIQSSLANPALYLGNTTTTDGVLLNGTYSVPSNADVDTSLIWGDYYFVQGCFRAMSAPAQVTNLRASTSASNQIGLSWDAQSGAIRYSVKRSTTSGGPYETIAPPPVLTASGFVDTTVTPGTTYYYVVSASSVAGEGPNSAEAVVTTAFGTLTTDFTLSVSPDNITVATPGASSAPMTLTVKGTNGYNGTISFAPSSCAITPAGSLSTCSFNPPSITGSGSTQLVIGTTAPSNSGAATDFFDTGHIGSGRSELPAVGICGLFLFMILVVFRKQPRFTLVFGSVVLIALFGLWACGGSASSGLSGNSTSGSGSGSGATNSNLVPGTPTGVVYTVSIDASPPGINSHSINLTFSVK